MRVVAVRVVAWTVAATVRAARSCGGEDDGAVVRREAAPNLRGREREAEGEIVRARGAAPADRALEGAVLLQHGEGGDGGQAGGRTAVVRHVLAVGRRQSFNP